MHTMFGMAGGVKYRINKLGKLSEICQRNASPVSHWSGKWARLQHQKKGRTELKCSVAIHFWYRITIGNVCTLHWIQPECQYSRSMVKVVAQVCPFHFFLIQSKFGHDPCQSVYLILFFIPCIQPILHLRNYFTCVC